MKLCVVVLLLTLLLAGCKHDSPMSAKAFNDAGEVFVQGKIDNKWQVDRATAEELRGMGMTIDNFWLLNKKKFENSGAYQEFGLLLENHISRIDAYCALSGDCKRDLYVRLDSIKAEVPILSTGELEKGKAALLRIKNVWAGVDTAFSYQY